MKKVKVSCENQNNRYTRR